MAFINQVKLWAYMFFFFFFFFDPWWLFCQLEEQNSKSEQKQGLQMVQ